MKKIFFFGILGMFFLGSCGNKGHQEGHDHASNVHNHESHEGHNHEEHDHANCNHDHEGHEHDGHHHEGHDHEGHHHDHEGHNHDAHGHNHSHDAHGHSHGHDAHGHEHSDEIMLPKAKALTAGVKAIKIQPSTFQQVIKTSGEVINAQGEESVAVATVTGVVSFRGNVTEGMAVRQGSPVVILSSNHIAEGDPVERARVAYEVSKKEYERMKELTQGQIVSEKEFAQAKQKYENARISYEALAKNHSAKGQQVTAPLSGYIKNILVKEGDYVTVGQPLFSVTKNKRLYLRAEVSEKYYPYLNQIKGANFETPYNNKVYELKQFNGKLLSFGKTSADNSFFIPVTFEFDNKSDIVPGAFVEVYLLGAPMENVITLPRTALTEEQGVYFVYLQVHEEAYKKQEVTIGASNGKEVHIVKGVKAGDRVVTEGAYQVRLAGASNAIPAHSHEH